MRDKIRTGLDLIISDWPKQLNGASIGLLAHPASVNRNLQHALFIGLKSRKFELRALFGPQHGFRGETQDNMIEWEGYRDNSTGLPVYSLYGEAREPSSEMLRDIDVMVIDLQDVGSRYYTFIWTMALVIKSCRNAGKPVVVLDRPNPIGGRLTEGPVLDHKYRSFVGLYPIPVRHGMTIGEIALCIKPYTPGLELFVISMRGWKRRMWFEDTGLPWVLPSPNMPTIETATVYPGMCLLEGTNLSEGRGTTRPFEIFGAPFIDPDALIRRLSEFRLPGVTFRPLSFLPTFQKFAGTVCGGAQIHVTEKEKFRPFRTGIAIIKAAFELYGKDFSWKRPPYEYEKRLLPFDILAGTDRVRNDIEKGVDLKEMETWWDGELKTFNKGAGKSCLLYRDRD
jgi:uncharacterized protein YbbC (DUF1343 family)